MGWKVDKWRTEDKEEKVYSDPGPVEVDIVVQEGKKILIEIKSSVSPGDVGAFISENTIAAAEKPYPQKQVVNEQ